MPDIKVDIDISGYVEQVEQAQQKNIPFATAKALTRTAMDGQIEVKRDIQRKFTLRNDWTQRGIRITPAEKLSWPITAEVYTDTGTDAAPDYLLGQEDGGEKVPHNGHSYIAIPTKWLREIIGNSTVIPAALRPKELLAAFTATHVSRRSKKDVRTPIAQQYVGFKQYYKEHLYIFVRRPNGRDIFPLYLLKPEVSVRAVLDMGQTVSSVANDRFAAHWDDAWDEIVDRG